MGTTITTAVTLPKPLYEQVEALASSLNISSSQLFALAVERLIEAHSPEAAPPERSSREHVINRGDIFWVQLADDAEPRIPHPHVVLQENIFNHSRIKTVTVCALTTNLKRASSPGNVLLDAGEAKLPRQSVVEVSKVTTVEKTQLGEYIGSLTPQRIDQILAGLRFLQLSFFTQKVK